MSGGAAIRFEAAARRWAGRYARRALILVYHRVAEIRPDPWSLAVTPAHFAEHLEVVRRFCRPVALRQLTAAVRDRSVPRGAVAVTFDDGYADNLHNAAPLLEEHGVPATVFVTAGKLDDPREFWWDDLERLLLEPGTLPDRLEVEIRGTVHSWELGEAARYDASDAQRHEAWNAWLRPPTVRHRIYLRIWALLQPLEQAERDPVLERLAQWAGRDGRGRAAYRIMTREEVTRLDGGGLVEIGAHTVTHPILSALPAAEQRQEIRQSKASLEAVVEQPLTSFAYPFGSHQHYTRATVRLVREAGFGCACTTHSDATTRFADPYQLPRFYMEDMDGDAFAGILSQMLRVRVG